MLAPALADGAARRPAPPRAGRGGDDGRPDRRRHAARARTATSSCWADWFLDATETGALLPLAGAEHVTGFESRERTGEPHGPAEDQPDNLQPVTVCFALDHRAGEDHTIDRPAGYDALRRRASAGSRPTRGRSRPVARRLAPNPDEDPLTVGPDFDDPDLDKDLWRFRRIAARGLFAPGAYPSDITLVNWPQVDYSDAPVLDGDGRRRPRAEPLVPALDADRGRLPRPAAARRRGRRHARRARQGALHPRGAADPRAAHRGRAGHRARRPRRARRGASSPTASASATTGSTCTRRPAATRTSTSPAARSSCRSARSCTSALENLIAAGKCLGTTHITNGAYRLHPVEWNAGEAAGPPGGVLPRAADDARARCARSPACSPRCRPSSTRPGSSAPGRRRSGAGECEPRSPPGHARARHHHRKRRAPRPAVPFAEAVRDAAARCWSRRARRPRAGARRRLRRGAVRRRRPTDRAQRDLRRTSGTCSNDEASIRVVVEIFAPHRRARRAARRARDDRATGSPTWSCRRRASSPARSRARTRRAGRQRRDRALLGRAARDARHRGGARATSAPSPGCRRRRPVRVLHAHPAAAGASGRAGTAGRAPLPRARRRGAGAAARLVGRRARAARLPHVRLGRAGDAASSRRCTRGDRGARAAAGARPRHDRSRSRPGRARPAARRRARGALDPAGATCSRTSPRWSATAASARCAAG